MTTSELTVNPSFAESERAIAEQQARRELVIGVVTFALVSIALLGLAFGVGLSTTPLRFRSVPTDVPWLIAFGSMWILSLIKVQGDVSRWRFFQRANAADVFRDLQQPEPEFPVWAVMPGEAASSATDIQRVAVRRSALVFAASALLTISMLVLVWNEPALLSSSRHRAGVGVIPIVCLVLVPAWGLVIQMSRLWRLSHASPEDAVRQLKLQHAQHRSIDSDTAGFWMIVAFVVLFVLSLIFKRWLF